MKKAKTKTKKSVLKPGDYEFMTAGLNTLIQHGPLHLKGLMILLDTMIAANIEEKGKE